MKKRKNMKILSRLILLALIVIPMLVACSPETGSSNKSAVPAYELKVMTFNIWLGGEVVDFSKVIEVIQTSGADVVGLQEAEGNTIKIAERLGWFHSERTMIISRYPIIEPPAAQSPAGVDYVYIQFAPGKVAAVANLHLTSDPYGPYAVRDGLQKAEVLELENSVRVREIEAALESWQELNEAGIPLLVTGDFNTPSHLDWTADTVNSLPHMQYAVEWPVTLRMEENGFVDTFRVANPDVLKDPGRTWSYGYPYPRLRPLEAIDRIDLIFSYGAVETLKSEVVGPPGSPDVDITVDPYPSDHRAVVSTVRLTPGWMPVYVAVGNIRVETGDPLLVHYHAPYGEKFDQLYLVRVLPDGSEEQLMWLPPQEADIYGAIRFGTGGLKTGKYAVVLISETDKELSRSEFWVVAKNAVPLLRVDNATAGAADTIVVEWRHAPARKRDWLGIYPAGVMDLYSGYYGFAYTGASVNGSYSFTPQDLGLEPGNYQAVLFSDDGYAILATVEFEVTP